MYETSTRAGSATTRMRVVRSRSCSIPLRAGSMATRTSTGEWHTYTEYDIFPRERTGPRSFPPGRRKREGQDDGGQRERACVVTALIGEQDEGGDQSKGNGQDEGDRARRGRRVSALTRAHEVRGRRHRGEERRERAEEAPVDESREGALRQGPSRPDQRVCGSHDDRDGGPHRERALEFQPHPPDERKQNVPVRNHGNEPQRPHEAECTCFRRTCE